jgi:XTP/dITP diphosphohydrolase
MTKEKRLSRKQPVKKTAAKSVAVKKSAKQALKKRLQTRTEKSIGKKFERLYAIVELLRTDCPWDKKQTPDSLVHLTLEEVYELIHAVDTHDEVELKKELGDILLHICFQALLAKERKTFDVSGVLDAIAEKLISRHPHVFGSETMKTEADVNRNWERLKMKEGRKSVFDGVPKAMPELLRAYRVQAKASGVSFDWKYGEDVLKKLVEEVSELQTAKTAAEREEEFGDILFTLVNYSRFIKVNPEDALRKTTEKFIRRFQYIEARVAESGKAWNELSLADLDAFWNEAKQHLKKK